MKEGSSVIKYRYIRYIREGETPKRTIREHTLESYDPKTRLDRFVMFDSKDNPVYERDIVSYANRSNETMDLIVLFDGVCWGLYRAEYLEYPYIHLRFSEKHKIVVKGILPLKDRI